jgi:hypothetical protein
MPETDYQWRDACILPMSTFPANSATSCQIPSATRTCYSAPYSRWIYVQARREVLGRLGAILPQARRCVRDALSLRFRHPSLRDSRSILTDIMTLGIPIPQHLQPPHCQRQTRLPTPMSSGPSSPSKRRRNECHDSRPSELSSRDCARLGLQILFECTAQHHMQTPPTSPPSVAGKTSRNDTVIHDPRRIAFRFKVSQI